MCVTRRYCFLFVANTASLLAGLVERERRKGHGISVPGSLQEEAQHVSMDCELHLSRVLSKTERVLVL